MMHQLFFHCTTVTSIEVVTAPVGASASQSFLDNEKNNTLAGLPERWRSFFIALFFQVVFYLLIQGGEPFWGRSLPASG